MNLPPDGSPLSAVLRSWLHQAGYPIVAVIRHGNKTRLRQECNHVTVSRQDGWKSKQGILLIQRRIGVLFQEGGQKV